MPLDKRWTKFTIFWKQQNLRFSTHCLNWSKLWASYENLRKLYSTKNLLFLNLYRSQRSVSSRSHVNDSKNYKFEPAWVHFHLALAAASTSHFVTAATKFSCCSSNKECLLSLALDLCRPFSRWVSLASRLLSLFLCLSLAPYSKFVDMIFNLSLTL